MILRQRNLLDAQNLGQAPKAASTDEHCRGRMGFPEHGFWNYHAAYDDFWRRRFGSIGMGGYNRGFPMTPARQPHPQRCTHEQVCKEYREWYEIATKVDSVCPYTNDCPHHRIRATHTSPPAQAFNEEDVVKEIGDAFDRGYAVAMGDIEDMGREKEKDCLKRIKVAREQVLDEIESRLEKSIWSVSGHRQRVIVMKGIMQSLRAQQRGEP